VCSIIAFMINWLKLLYFPGLFSLPGLLGFIIVTYQKVIPKPEFVITYFAPSDIKPHNPFTKSFSKYGIIDDLISIKIISITLDNDYSSNKKKIDLIRLEAQKLKYTNNYSSAILITLKDDVRYSEFIAILNICVMDNHERYAAFDDKFVIFGPRETKKERKQKAKEIEPLYL
jgi:hypothetical protein